MEKNYEFDVAVSFLYQDESDAQKIIDCLPGISSFIYKNRQEEIVGDDALLKFKKVFGYDARVVVLLFRDNWGKTPFTYAEEEAIRDRKFREMTEKFMIIINMTGKSKMPEWLSDRNVWYNLNEFGLKGLCGVIKKKVEERGGLSRPETLSEISDRKVREHQFIIRRNKFINSKEGVTAAEAEFRNLIDIIKFRVTEVNNELVNFNEDTSQSNWINFVIRGNLLTLSINWTLYLRNTLESEYENKYAHLDIQILKRNINVRDIQDGNAFKKIYLDSFNFDLFYPDIFGWRQTHKTAFIPTNNLAEMILRKMIESI